MVLAAHTHRQMQIHVNTQIHTFLPSLMMIYGQPVARHAKLLQSQSHTDALAHINTHR